MCIRDRERRESASDYYFRAENATTDNILLTGGSVFLYEEQTTPTGTSTTPVDNDFTLDALSSIKVSPETRAPIPKTGTIVASLLHLVKSLIYHLTLIITKSTCHSHLQT